MNMYHHMHFNTFLKNIFNDIPSNGFLRGSLIFVSLSFFPHSTFAAASDLLGFVDMLIAFVSEIIPLLIGCAIVVFFWGIVKFVIHADDEKAVEEGKQVMIWGLVGIFVIVALWAIVGYVQSSLGLNISNPQINAPSAPRTIP